MFGLRLFSSTDLLKTLGISEEMRMLIMLIRWLLTPHLRVGLADWRIKQVIVGTEL